MPVPFSLARPPLAHPERPARARASPRPRGHQLLEDVLPRPAGDRPRRRVAPSSASPQGQACGCELNTPLPTRCASVQETPTTFAPPGLRLKVPPIFPHLSSCSDHVAASEYWVRTEGRGRVGGVGRATGLHAEWIASNLPRASELHALPLPRRRSSRGVNAGRVAGRRGGAEKAEDQQTKPQESQLSVRSQS